MTLTKKTDHDAEALAYLINQFKNKPKLAAAVSADIQQIQDLENVFFGMLVSFLLGDAEGDQLNTLGAIVGEDRNGRNDDDYRLGIRARIRINLSEGTPEELIELLVLLNGGTATLKFEEYFPASIIMKLVDVVASEAEGVQMAGYLKDAKLGGVLLHLVYSANPVGERFQFDTSGQGFDEGKYVGVT